MNICIPVESDAGLQSSVNAHFGSAPVFLIVDTDTMDIRAVANKNRVHAHGISPSVPTSRRQIVSSLMAILITKCVWGFPVGYRL